MADRTIRIFAVKDDETLGHATLTDADELTYDGPVAAAMFGMTAKLLGPEKAFLRFANWSNGYSASREVGPSAPVHAALGHDVTPGHDELHHYWTRGEGLAKWAESPTPWTTLVAHLTKHVGPEKAKVYASAWVHEVFHEYTGSDVYRLEHGGKIRGHRIGRG